MRRATPQVRGRLVRLLPEAVLLLSLVGLHLGYLSFPPEDPDVGGITYNAMLISRGMVPYRDSFEQKLPGAFFLVAAWTRLLGERVTALTIASLAWSAAHLVAILWGVTRLWGVGPARWAGIAFVLASTAPVISGRCPNYEVWMTMPLTWGLLVLMTPGEGFARLVGAGFLLAFGVSVKQQASFSCLPVLLWLVQRVRRERRGALRPVASLALGAVLVPSAILAYFLVVGELATFVRMVDPRGAIAYAAGGGAPAGLVWRIARQETMRVVREMPLLYHAGTVVIVASIWQAVGRRGLGSVQASLVLWILGGALGVSSGMRFYTHYYVQLVPPLCVAVGWLSHRLSEPRARSPFAALLLASILAWPSLGRVGHDLRMAWWQTKFALQGRPMPSPPSVELARTIRSATPPGAPILVWGHAEDLYFLAGRLAPTRYYKYFAFLAPPPVTWGPPALNPRASDHVERFLRQIAARPPSAIVVCTSMGSAPPDLLPEFARFLRAYRHQATFDGLQLWLPGDDPSGGET